MPELLEVVVVCDLPPQPLPDRLDRVQIGAVGWQEAQPQAWVGGDELDEARAAMPGRSIEDEHHQHSRIGPQELLAEALEVDGGQPGGDAAMELARHHVEGPEAVELLMGARPVARQGLLAGEAPLAAKGRGELEGDLVLEEDGQAMGCLVGEPQEPTDLSFFSRRRQAGTAGRRCRGRRRRAPKAWRVSRIASSESWISQVLAT